MGMHDWPAQNIIHFRRGILRVNVENFAEHWQREDGRPLTGRSIQAYEQDQRRPSLYVRQAMTRALYRLGKKGVDITMPVDNKVSLL
jgi:hypothetical protein